MGLYLCRGSRAVLTDEGPLESALSYSDNTVVHVTLAEPRAELVARSQGCSSAADPRQLLDAEDLPPASELSAGGHVTLGWHPPRNATGESADVVVTGFRQEVTVTVAIGTWSGLDLKKVCSQRWCVPLNSTNMSVYR